MALNVKTKTYDGSNTKSGGAMSTAIHGYNDTQQKFIPLKIDDTGRIITDASITGDVTVDVDEINAEMKVDSGHDLYSASNVTGDGTWTVTFDSVSGLALEDIQALENRTTGEVYNTAGATVTDTSIALVSGNNTGKTEPQGSDSLELVYRGISRFDDKATDATLTSIKDTDGIKKITDNVNIGDLSAGTQTNDVKVTLDGETATVTATDLDIRDLTSASDSIEAVQSVAADLNMTEVNSGDILTSVQLIDDSIATTDSAATSKNTQIGLVAESTIPTEVGDGDSVPVWADTFGRQVIAGFSQAVNSLNTQEVSPAELLTIESTMLDAVTATGASSAIDLSNYNKVKFQVVKSGTATVDIQESLDDSTYDNVQTDVDGIVTISGEALKYVKAVVSAYTDGNVTVKMIGGR